MDNMEFSSEAGFFLKSKNKLQINQKFSQLDRSYENILKTGVDFTQIRTKDIMALNAQYLGFKSLFIVILGGFFALFGLATILSTYGIPLLIGAALIFYGSRKQSQIRLDYCGFTQQPSVCNYGEVVYNSNEELPTEATKISSFLFSKKTHKEAKIAFKVEETLYGIPLKMITRTKTLYADNDFLQIMSDKSAIHPSERMVIPLENIISIKMVPSRLKSIPLSVFGALIGINGIVFIFTSLDSIPSGIITLLLGVIMVMNGIQRIVSLEINYAQIGSTVFKIKFSGKAIDDPKRFENLGEEIFQLIKLNKKQFNEEVMK